MTFVDMQVKWSVTLTDPLGPEILTVLEIKGQVLHVKVPGWLFNNQPGTFTCKRTRCKTLIIAMLSLSGLYDLRPQPI